MGIDQRPQRRDVKTWADDGWEVTHYASNGMALLLCARCLLTCGPDEKLSQAVTILNGTAYCEDHLYPAASGT